MPRAHAPGGASQTVTLPDITGTGANVCLATSGTARWIQIIAPSGNSAVVRLGYGATSSRGAAIAAGGGFFFPPLTRQDLAPVQNVYALAETCMYIANGDSVTVTYLP
jgi:hypothetical protein